MSGTLPNVQHVVILMLENRSFDGYFGTFPGANGFYNNPQSAFGNAWVPSPGGWTGPSVLPYRLSTFTSQQGHTPACNHGWAPEHAFFAGGAMNGWSLQNPGAPADAGNPVGCMGYYAADDIPYHWWLAQNFALCDNYFCSHMGVTEPNRLYLISGRIDNSSEEFLNNPSTPTGQNGQSTAMPGYYSPAVDWQSYADFLTAAGVSWKLYDPAPTLDGSLNPFVFFSSWPQVEASSSLPAPLCHYAPDPDDFANDANGDTLPAVSWIVPNYAYSEHPNLTSWDGAAYIAQVVKPLLSSRSWESTVLIITYDETDGHFDHVPPPQPDESAFPEEFVNGMSLGAGFRVPTFVISPWTVGRGICSDPYDHTSILMFLEEVTGVQCGVTSSTGFTDNLSPWRRQTFKSLSTITSGFGGPPPAVTVPVPPDAGTLQAKALARYNDAPNKQDDNAANQWQPALSPSNLVPSPQTWPPVAQGCQVIVVMPSFSPGQVQAQTTLTGSPSFPGALQVVVDGFEPAELTTPNAVGTISTVAAASPATMACSTRVPEVTITDASGNQAQGISVGVPEVDFDPNSQVNQTQSGVPSRFTFTYPLTFDDPASAFSFPAGTVQVLAVNASFAVDITVTSYAELELVNSDDPQFYHLFYDDTSYLSGELRVFPVVAGQSFFGVQLPMSPDRTDAFTFIDSVMTTLTQNQGQVPGLPQGEISSFDQLNETEEGSSLPLSPTDTTLFDPNFGLPVFNFALARVRLQADSSDPAAVRVFFRSFRASSTSTAYETPYAYRTYPDEGSGDQPAPPSPPDTKIPLLGVGYGQTAGEYVTIPFFATERIQLTNPSVPMTWQQDPPNVQVMQTGKYGVPSGGTVEAYFGCWLDINQPGVSLFPRYVPTDPALVDGPFDPLTTLSIQQAFTIDTHQCLVAEISYDPIVIPTGDSTSNSAWLAQRNLGLIPAW